MKLQSKLLAWALVILKLDLVWNICFQACLNSYWWLLDGDLNFSPYGPEIPHDRIFFFRMIDQREKEIEAMI